MVIWVMELGVSSLQDPESMKDAAKAGVKVLTGAALSIATMKLEGGHSPSFSRGRHDDACSARCVSPLATAVHSSPLRVSPVKF